ncbi:MAG: universal stress protein [Planctomycetaceae bacterium]
MSRPQNILVGVDLSRAKQLTPSELSPPTVTAIEQGMHLAAQWRARLTFFCALDVSPERQALLADGDGVEGALRQAHAVLHDLAERAAAEGIEAAALVAAGAPWIEIIQQVQRTQHDLVIVGTRDLGMAGRLLFGSTGLKLLRHCPCPVWVARPDADPQEVNILVASDLSDVSERALALGVEVAKLSGAKFHLVHALQNQSVGALRWMETPESVFEEARDQDREQAERALREQLARTDYRTLPFGVRLEVIDGSPENVILDLIEAGGIDLLVMGTRGRSGFQGLVIGNTAERLLPQANCSLLAVKPDDFQCPVSLDE